MPSPHYHYVTTWSIPKPDTLCVADFVLQGGSDKKYEVGEPGTIMTDCFIEENAMKSFMGIDVGAKSVVVSVWRAGRILRMDTFAQTPEGH